MTAFADAGLASAAAAGTTVAWFTLAGALGGVLVTSVVGLTTAALNHRWQARDAENARLLQHGAQVRAERRESYAAYWLAWNQFIHDLRRMQEQIQQLPPGVVVNRHLTPPAEGPGDGEADVTRQLLDLSARAWETELRWRAAADALLLIAGPAVASAAEAHIAVTEQKLTAAWQGRAHPDKDGAAYRGLNDAMRADLLSPGRPEQWAP